MLPYWESSAIVIQNGSDYFFQLSFLVVDNPGAVTPKLLRKSDSKI